MHSIASTLGLRPRLVTALAVLLLVTACAGVKPFEYTEIHEIQPGPGLLAGTGGEFVLYGDEPSPADK